MFGVRGSGFGVRGSGFAGSMFPALREARVSLADTLLPEFDHEMTITRALLERVPEAGFGWAPHARSMTLGRLAQHVATLPMWGAVTLNEVEFDAAVSPQPAQLTTRGEILALFDKHVADARKALVGRTDAELMVPWTFKNNGHTIFSMPRASVWRSFVMSHIVHHRGQLSVYLRMQDVPVPSMYGPSADEA